MVRCGEGEAHGRHEILVCQCPDRLTITAVVCLMICRVVPGSSGIWRWIGLVGMWKTAMSPGALTLYTFFLLSFRILAELP